LEVRRQWANIFKVLKKKNLTNQESYNQQNCPSKVRDIKTVSDKQKRRSFTTFRPVLQEMLKEVRKVELKVPKKEFEAILRNKDLNKCEHCGHKS
jgi:hypothetical protein